MNRRTGAALLVLLAGCAPLPRPAPTSTTSRVPVTTTTAVTALPAAQEPDRLERQHRLAAVLPHATAHYRIDYTVGADGRLHVSVTVLAVLNGADDLGGYSARLRQYAAEAMAFITAQGDDPSTYTVAWRPPIPQ